jgi:hypothetical protein
VPTIPSGYSTIDRDTDRIAQLGDQTCGHMLF